MTDNFDTASKKLLDLDRRITQEIGKASEELKNLKDNKNNTDINYHRLNHIHDLFDEASEVIRQIKFDGASDNTVSVLEAKRHIQESFGAFQFIQREVNSIANSLEKDEKVLELTPEEPVMVVDTDVGNQEPYIEPVVQDEEYFDEYELEMDAAEAVSKAKQKKKEKVSQERKRQEKLRYEREARENAYHSQNDQQAHPDYTSDSYKQNQEYYRFINDFDNNDRFSQQQRQEEAYRLGMRVTEDRPVTATELKREEYRQFEQELADKNKEEALRQQEQQTFEKYRQREEEISNYQSFGNEHIDFSSEYQKERNEQRAPEEDFSYESQYHSYSDSRKPDYNSTRPRNNGSAYKGESDRYSGIEADRLVSRQSEEPDYENKYQSYTEDRKSGNSPGQNQNDDPGYKRDPDRYSDIGKERFTDRPSEKFDNESKYHGYTEAGKSDYNSTQAHINDSVYKREPDRYSEPGVDSSVNRPSDRDSYYNYKFYSYAPADVNDSDYSVYENKYERFNDNRIYDKYDVVSNRDIYKSIENQIGTAKETGTAATISAVYTDMLKRNVDAAHDHWKEVRGTPEESIAIQQYKEQRQYLYDVKRDIRNNAYKIEGERYTPVNHIPYEENKRTNNNTLFSAYVPGGTVSEPSSYARGTAGRYSHNEYDRGNNFFYTPENPMVVSREYRDAIYNRAKDSYDTFNKLVDYGQNSKTGPLKISEGTSAEIALAMDAYKGFRNAEKAGVVVVSDESGRKNPDFDLWQQRKDIRYDSWLKNANRKIDFNISNDKENGLEFFKYTPEKPMVVSKEYRDAIYNRAKEVQKEASLQTSPGHKGKADTIKLHPNAIAEAKLATDAYKGFRNAQKAGVVIVSEEAEAKTPDFRLWQQLKDAKYDPETKSFNPRPAPDVGEGTQGGFKFFNRTKAGLQDSPHFSQKKLYDAHFKRIYGHAERYATRAGRMFGRRMYSMLQSGDDNALRTFEQGRYYVSTGIVFTNAVVHARVINSGKAATLADSSRLALADKISGNIKLQNYQATNDLRVKLYKELESEKFIGVTRKQIGRKVDELTMIHRAKVEKKFGELAKISDAKLAKEIEVLKLSGINIKLKIKELESLGATISPAQRKTLLELKKLHEANSLKLRKLFGLKKERDTMDLTLGILRSSSDKISKNIRAYSNGLYALRNFISKPFREGDVYAAGGLYNAATFIANRHTRMILKKSIKATMWVSARSVDAAFILTGNNPMIWHNAVDVVKLNTKVKINATKKTIKNITNEAGRKTIKTARQGAKFVGNTIADFTPTKIRTAAKGGWNGLVSAKRKIDFITGSIRERYQRSIVHKGISAARTWIDRTAKSIKLFFSTASKIRTKALLAFGGVFAVLVLLISIMGTFLSGSTAASTILSPYDSANDKINLAPYMEVLNKEQADFDATLNKTLQTKKFKGKEYDKVTVNYATSLRSNHKEMLSMMAVRFKQDISLLENLSVKQYLKSLYHDSHTLAAKESELYSCSGCEKRTVYCDPGCKEYVNYCDNKIALALCNNKTEDGNCAGHATYYCPGHEENYCPGKHIDLTLTVSVLGFDEIFSADSMGNAGANVQAGGLIGNATITYYCAEKYPHICNAGPPYKTASGTTPTPNRTIAVDPNKIPLGTHVVIFGQEYVAEDTGGAVDGMHVDILVATHAEALAKGTRYDVPVYNVSIEGEGGMDAERWEGWTKDNIEWAKLIYSPNWGEIYEGINDYGDGKIEIGNLVVAGDWVWPVTSTTASSGFGWRDDPMNPGNPDFHKGTDIAIPEGTPVHAAGDGTVAAAKFSSSAGNMIIINHADGVVTKYFHNSQLLVSVGDTVKAGQVIAYSGNTGNSTGPHLHFEFWVNGKVTDPRLQYGL